MLLLHAAADLLGRPFLGQALTDKLVDLGIFHLPLQRTLPPPPLRFSLGLRGKVVATRTIAPQFTADG
jgi:hypothetical protein